MIVGSVDNLQHRQLRGALSVCLGVVTVRCKDAARGLRLCSHMKSSATREAIARSNVHIGGKRTWHCTNTNFTLCSRDVQPFTDQEN